MGQWLAEIRCGGMGDEVSKRQESNSEGGKGRNPMKETTMKSKQIEGTNHATVHMWYTKQECIDE